MQTQAEYARRQPAFQAQLAAKLAARLAQAPAGIHLGVEVIAVKDGRRLFAYNANDRFIPASVAKVLTASAALAELGPQYRFETELLLEGVNRAARSARNIYLRGSGDPSLGMGDLAELCAALRQQGIQRITGEIVIDDSAFDAVPWARGWMWDDLADGFSAPVSGVNVAGNALSLQLSANRRGEPIRVQQWPATRFVNVLIDAITVAPSAPFGLRVLDGADHTPLDGPPAPADAFHLAPESGRQLADVALTAGQKVLVGGSMSESQSTLYRRLAVRNPAAWASTLLREQLVREGIEPPSSWRRGVVPPLAEVVAGHRSEELAALVSAALKSSDNHTMECVLKRLGANATLQPGTFLSGTQVVRRHLMATLGDAQVEEPLLLDGSGLSRYNLVTPRLMAATLAAAGRAFVNGPELIVGLPISGIDGTLAHRLRGPLRSRVRAKTGTMAGVSSLVGLLTCDDGEQLAFAILLDRFIGSSEQARALQDDLLQMLAASGQAA